MDYPLTMRATVRVRRNRRAFFKAKSMARGYREFVRFAAKARLRKLRALARLRRAIRVGRAIDRARAHAVCVRAGAPFAPARGLSWYVAAGRRPRWVRSAKRLAANRSQTITRRWRRAMPATMPNAAPVAPVLRRSPSEPPPSGTRRRASHLRLVVSH